VIGRLAGVVLDCPDPHALAGFHSQLLGLPITKVDRDWVDIGHGTTTCLSFQHAPDTSRHAGPTRPSRSSSTFRVDADPAGHPFCLCTQ
jgi:catechol-2,3-dioxygenase